MAPPPAHRGEAAAFVGLTGAIAAGKTEALRAFARAGAATLSADEVVHDLLSCDSVVSTLAGRWGEAVVRDGRVDRDGVAALVFEQPEELAWLEATLHPLVGERVIAWRAGLPADTRLAVVEVPLLFETELEEMFDATVTVVADDRMRERRAGARGTGALEGRADRQLSQEEKARRSDHVIHNDGSLADLEAEVARVASEVTPPESRAS